PNEVDPARVGTAAVVVGEVRLGVDRAVGLSCDEVEASDAAVGDKRRLPETGRAQAVRIDSRIDVGAALAIDRILVGHHDLARGTDGRVAVVTVAGTGDVLRGAESPEPAEPGDGRPKRLNLLSRRTRVTDPDAVRADRDRRLVAVRRNV